MRKMISLCAVCVVVAGVAAAPAAAKKPKIGADVTADLPLPAPGTTTATITGSVKSLSACRRSRNVRVEFVDSNGAVVPGAGGSGLSAGNGSFSFTVFYPTTPGTYTINGILDAANRRLKGLKVKCTETRGSLGTVTALP